MSLHGRCRDRGGEGSPWRKNPRAPHRIDAVLEDGLPALCVHNDGAGFGGSAALGPGLRLSNIHARLDLLYGGAATLEVAPGESGA